MGYELTLEKAGAKVIAIKEFGSYQGTWLALVEYKEEKGIVEGAYGSCSGCDAYEATFGYNDTEPTIKDGKHYKNDNTYDEDNECTAEEFTKYKQQYDKKLADFGSEYLKTGLYDKAHYQQRLDTLKQKEDQDDWFDNEEKEYCEWAIAQDF